MRARVPKKSPHLGSVHQAGPIASERIFAEHSRCAPMRGFKLFAAASTTLAGIELAHRIRKRQFICQPRNRHGPLDLRRAWYVAIMV